MSMRLKKAKAAGGVMTKLIRWWFNGSGSDPRTKGPSSGPQ
jgi:hypothetical protein